MFSRSFNVVKPLLLVTGALCFLVSCFEIPEPKQELKPDAFYRRQMQLEINGKRFNGVANLALEQSYKIKVTTQGRLDLISFKNCHRDDVFEPHSYDFEYTYVPLKEETQKFCPMEIVGLEKKKGRHAWAFLNFDTSDHNMKAIVRCNGQQVERFGTVACQSAVGLMQYLEFTFPVKISASEQCPIDMLKDERFLSIQLSKGYCVYEIKDKQSDRYFRFVTVGYEQIILQED